MTHLFLWVRIVPITSMQPPHKTIQINKPLLVLSPQWIALQILPIDIFGNPKVAALPNRLRKYVVTQPYNRYTPIDHTFWRHVMRQNYRYLKDAS